MASGKFLANDGSEGVRDTAANMLSEQPIAEMVSSWAESSNNDHALSLLIQEQAEDVFNLVDAFQWDFTKDTTRERMAEARKNQSGLQLIREFVISQYGLTQKRLKDLNVSRLMVWRGQTASSKQILSSGIPEYLSMRPISSYSIDQAIAENFSQHESDGVYYESSGSVNMTLGVEVPASRVFGMPGCGFGCFHENEVVVLGGTIKYDYLSASAKVNDGETMADILKRYDLIDQIREYFEGKKQGIFGTARAGEFAHRFADDLYEILLLAGQDAMFAALKILMDENRLPADLVELANKAIKEAQPSSSNVDPSILKDIFEELGDFIDDGLD
jgi:hypothetical protein